ncbi:glutaredoxin family protein [bacterium]|nr:glutaredoxin family protein [bacterium]
MILRWLGFGRKVRLAKAKRMYQPTTVRLFIKPFCGWCVEAMEWLDRNKIKYNVLDVSSDRAAWDEMVGLSGQSSAPVIEVDGEMLADFGASELAQFWNELS